MSIQSEVNRLKTNVSNSFAAIAEKGGTVMAGANSDDLAAAILTIPSGGGVVPPIPSFTYSVADGYEIVTDEETGAWKIRFLTSGALVFTSEPPLVDVWMCGGGGGSCGTTAGGGGGYVSGRMKYQPVIGEEYTITIGAGGKAGTSSGNGGAGGKTYAFGLHANGGGGGSYASGKGGAGGTGGNGKNASGAGATDGADGVSSSSYDGGTGYGMTTREFWEPDGTLYCSGGASTGGSAGGVNTGDGGSRKNAGGSGIVIIRGSAV